METQKKLVLVADLEVESETFRAPWGKVWTRGADVMATFRRHGFVPPSTVRTDYFFLINRRGGGK